MSIRTAKRLAQQVPQRLYWTWAALFLLAACGGDSVSPPSAPPPSAFTGDVEGVHDPSLIKQGSTYYVFSTDTGQTTGHLPIRCSPDLKRWTLCGRVFDEIPGWIPPLIPGVQGLWAPDISFVSGKYHLYYAASTYGSNRSLIALATNATLDASSPDYAWVDEGVVLESQTSDDWNAIDPNVFKDEQGRVWMSWGSFWGGIKMRRLDPQTGKLSMEDSTLYSLAGRPAETAIEAPFLFRKDAYFLFVSFDYCCRGAESTYKMMTGRSNEVTGPYTDRNGAPLLAGGGTLLLASEGAWRGPGGQSLYRDGVTDLIIYHAYSATTGRPSLQVARLLWTDGWPQVLPLP